LSNVTTIAIAPAGAAVCVSPVFNTATLARLNQNQSITEDTGDFAVDHADGQENGAGARGTELGLSVLPLPCHPLLTISPSSSSLLQNKTACPHLGGHLKTGHTWTLKPDQRRPTQKHLYLYMAGGRRARI
jgi:hypothetical protein